MVFTEIYYKIFLKDKLKFYIAKLHVYTCIIRNKFFNQLNFLLMNGIIGLGKYFFAIPMGIFGIMHFVAADQMAGMAPGGKFMVYFTGLALVLAAVSIVIGKMDKLAAVLLAVMLLLFIIPHAQGMAENEAEMFNILKNIAMAGGALLYAGQAKDNAVIG